MSPLQAQHSPCEQAGMMVKTVQAFHLKPRPLDSTYNDLVFKAFIQMLDPDQLVFCREEVVALEATKAEIAAGVQQGDCNFLLRSTALFAEKMQACIQVLENLKEAPIDWGAGGEVHFEPDAFGAPCATWEMHWKKWLQVQVLSHFIDEEEAWEEMPKLSKRKLKHLQRELAEQAICRLQKKIEQANGLEQFVADCFLEAIASSFDPHTNYFNPTQQSAFEGALSQDMESFGFEVDFNISGELEVVNLDEGGPARLSERLEIGDHLLGMTTRGTSYNFSCMLLNDIYAILLDPAVKSARFEVRKSNGKRLEVSLSKERIEVSQNRPYSFILEGEHKYGYIYLPSFYTQMDASQTEVNGCAMDVAKALLELRKEGIEGLIMDLRNNGGGSVEEAILLAGMFVNFGAVAISNPGRGEVPEILFDENKGMLYSDPLLVLVNPLSASASELFAAAMQDHNRALLVGAPTYGKSSMQNIVAIDLYRYLSDSTYNPNEEAEAYVKLTTSSMHRVNGGTHQFSGLQPDIHLPMLYEGLGYGESAFPSALQLDSIESSNAYFKYSSLPLEALRERSEERIANDSCFAAIDAANMILKNQTEVQSISLDFSSFWKAYVQADLSSILTKTMCKTSDFALKSPSYLNTSQVEGQQFLEIGLSSDIHLREAYFILGDYISLTARQGKGKSN